MQFFAENQISITAILPYYPNKNRTKPPLSHSARFLIS